MRSLALHTIVCLTLALHCSALIPGDSRSAWLIAKRHDLVVVGKLANPQILVVFVDGKPVQFGGDQIERTDDGPLEAIVLMAGDLKIEELVYDKFEKFGQEKSVGVTWVDRVSLREGHGLEIGGCEILTRAAKNGGRSILLLDGTSIGFEVRWDMDLEFLAWLRTERKEAKVAARRLEEKNKAEHEKWLEKNDPFKAEDN